MDKKEEKLTKIEHKKYQTMLKAKKEWIDANVALTGYQIAKRADLIIINKL